MAVNDAPRAARKARPKPSLKMQAIGFLSRREHSRQELREKLLASLRKRARDDAALAAAAERDAREIADALRTTPSNGIDDAFAPAVGSPAVAGSLRREPSVSRVAPLLDGVRFASGAALSNPLRASLAKAAAEGGLPASDLAVVGLPAVASQGGALVAVDDDAADADADADDDDDDDDDDAVEDPGAIVDQLLDWLVANKYLSDQRFVESRVNARARKQGAMMIRHELSRHGLVLEPEQAAALRETEFARAQALWQRRFGDVAADPRDRAKQARFLASRGFASDVVRRIVGGEEEC